MRPARKFVLAFLFSGWRRSFFCPCSAHEGRGFCLGNCVECYTLLESLPREPGAASASHLDIRSAGVEQLFGFVAAREVCELEEIYPLSLDREFWSIGALKGGAPQLNFAGATAGAHTAVAACRKIQSMAVDLLSNAYRAVGICSGPSGATDAASCGVNFMHQIIDAIMASWRATGVGTNGISAKPQKSFSLNIDRLRWPAGNQSSEILTAYLARVWDLLGVSHNFEILGGNYAAQTLQGAAVPAHDTLRTYHEMTTLAVQLARASRCMMESLRLAWSVQSLLTDVASIYPNIETQLPSVLFHTEVYGRHFDVLEWLLLSLQKTKSPSEPLRMAEMGVACGPIGLHLLLRFPELQYIGADPTIRPEVYQAYQRFGARAKLEAMKSEELHSSLPADEQFDIVFIDGPHTYKNVRNDIEMWEQRVRPGGVLAGHDFTCVHPPLLWAVLEARMTRGGDHVNVGLDGVWWWRVA